MTGNDEEDTVTRTEIIEQAKQTVLSRGPGICLEFTTEIIEQEGISEGSADFRKVYDEVIKQSVRVYHFLGYQAPFGHN